MQLSQSNAPTWITLKDVREFAKHEQVQGNLAAIHGFVNNIQLRRQLIREDGTLVYQGQAAGLILQLEARAGFDPLDRYVGQYKVRTQPLKEGPVTIINLEARPVTASGITNHVSRPLNAQRNTPHVG